MNLVYKDPSTPVRVMLVNPVGKTCTMLGIKLLRGLIFGPRQLIDLIFLVYENDLHHAKRLTWELQAGGFPCYNSITTTHVMPTLADADVFVFLTNLSNLNALDGNDLDHIETFNTFYLLITVAQNLEMPPPEPENNDTRKKKVKETKVTHRPVIIADGLVALDVLKTYSKNLPDDIFFCPSSISGIARSILGDQLKVHCGDLNYVYVWAADDDVFFVEVQSPIYLHEKKKERGKCEWHLMAESEYEQLGIDFIQFNAAWLMREFQDKVAALTTNHPHGFIFKADKMLKVLKAVWITRSMQPKDVYHGNIGVFSDGSLDTVKGLPYFLPIIFHGDTYTINNVFKDSVHLKQEIKRINKAAVANHKKLMAFCKKFYENNIIKKEYLPSSEDTVVMSISD